VGKIGKLAILLERLCFVLEIVLLYYVSLLQLRQTTSTSLVVVRKIRDFPELKDIFLAHLLFSGLR